MASSSKLDVNRMATVIDKEVAVAAMAQGLAPAGAVPPLMLSTLGAPIKPSMLIGGPTLPGHHQRASALIKPMAPTPEADAFARAEITKRLKVGGFHDSPGDTHPIFAVPDHSKPYLGESDWTMHMPQVPQNMRVPTSSESYQAFNQGSTPAKMAMINSQSASNGRSNLTRGRA